MPPRSPATAQMELTLRLRARRAEMGMPIREVSRNLEFTANYYSAVENGRALLAPDKLEMLCRLFELNAKEAAELQRLREIARGPRWTAEFSQILTDDLALYYGLEHGASRVRSYEGRVIPGLLQTDEYTAALIRDDPDTPGTRAARRMELRRRRRERLTDDDPLELTVLMSEAAIRQEIGGPAVLRNQLVALVDYIERLDNVDLRVVPFQSSPRGFVNASTVHLLEFPSPHLPVLAWREAVSPVGISDDSDMVDLLEVGFARAADSALSHAETIELLRSRIDDLGGAR